jgi:hypothetical protein
MSSHMSTTRRRVAAMLRLPAAAASPAGSAWVPVRRGAARCGRGMSRSVTELCGLLSRSARSVHSGGGCSRRLRAVRVPPRVAEEQRERSGGVRCEFGGALACTTTRRTTVSSTHTRSQLAHADAMLMSPCRTCLAALLASLSPTIASTRNRSRSAAGRRAARGSRSAGPCVRVPRR